MSSPAPASTIHILDLRTWKRAEVALVLGDAAANQKLLCKTSACGRTREHQPRSAQLKSQVLKSTELDIYPSGRLHGRSSCGKTELLWQGQSWLHHLQHRMFQNEIQLRRLRISVTPCAKCCICYYHCVFESN